MIYGTRNGSIVSMAPGYNMGGYYSGYSGYFNPYTYQNDYYKRMQEAKQHQEEQNKIFNRMVEINKKSLNKNFDVPRRDEDIELERLKAKMQRKMGLTSRLQSNHHQINTSQQKQDIAYANRLEYIHQQNTNKVKNVDSLYDFMDNGYILLQDIANQKQKQKMRQVDKLYDKSSYQRLLNMHSATGNNMFNMGPVSVDDMEVALPNSATQEYRNRREAFINSIMSV